MTRPRQILDDRAWTVTRRCTQRQFLLRPEPAINNAFLYCLIEAAQTTGVDLVLAQLMSNHAHESVYPRQGTVVDFYTRFHTNLARCVNSMRGRWENLWADRPTGLVECLDRDAWMNQLVYIATNPVKDGLVAKVKDWPGPKFVRALLEQRPLKATRPRFFRTDGPMPAEVELTPRIPPELGDPAEVIAELRRRIAEVEDACARERAKTGRRVVGRRQVLQASWRACPSTREPRRNLNPRVASRDKETRIAALQRLAQFHRDYRTARARWLAGLPALFPPGTFWLARHARVTVAEQAQPPTVVN